MDMDEIVLYINDKHMTAWVEACHRDSIPNTPLNPYLDKVLRNCYLSIQHILVVVAHDEENK